MNGLQELKISKSVQNVKVPISTDREKLNLSFERLEVLLSETSMLDIIPRAINGDIGSYKDIAGIYSIYNQIDDRIYIGSAVSIGSRLWGHQGAFKRGNHPNRHLQNFVNKYGIGSIAYAFIKEINSPTKSDLIEMEQYFLDTLGPEFNINKKADSCLGIKWRHESRKRLSEKRLSMNIRYDDDYKRRMSIALSGKNNPMYGKSPNWGKKHKPETIQKMIKSHPNVKGKNNPKYGIPQSPDATAKARITKRKNKFAKGRGVNVIKEGELIGTYLTAMEASEVMNINHTSIYRAIEKRNGRCKGFVFSFTGGTDAIPQTIRA